MEQQQENSVQERNGAPTKYLLYRLRLTIWSQISLENPTGLTRDVVKLAQAIRDLIAFADLSKTVAKGPQLSCT